MKRSWGDEFEQRRDLEINEDVEEIAEDKWDEEGALAGFEEAADHAYDEDIAREDKNKADWFDDELE